MSDKALQDTFKNLYNPPLSGWSMFYYFNLGWKMSRFDYVRYDDIAQNEQNLAKEVCTSLEKLIDVLGKGRAQALAITKLEECYMWIGKAIRDEQIKRNGTAELQEERKDG